MFRSKEFYRRQLFGWRCIFFFLWCLLLLPFAASAEDALIGSGFFEDPSSALTVDDVQSAAIDARFMPFAGILNRGYSSSAFWLKLEIQASSSRNQSSDLLARGYSNSYILRILPSYLDEIALYDPMETSKTVRFVGDQYPVPRNEYRSLNHNFTIMLAERPRTVWLRLKTSSTSMIKVSFVV